MSACTAAARNSAQGPLMMRDAIRGQATAQHVIRTHARMHKHRLVDQQTPEIRRRVGTERRKAEADSLSHHKQDLTCETTTALTGTAAEAPAGVSKPTHPCLQPLPRLLAASLLHHGLRRPARARRSREARRRREKCCARLADDGTKGLVEEGAQLLAQLPLFQGPHAGRRGIAATARAHGAAECDVALELVQVGLGLLEHGLHLRERERERARALMQKRSVIKLMLTLVCT